MESAEMRLAAGAIAGWTGTDFCKALVANLEKQTEALQNTISQRGDSRGSTIRVEPKVTWPHLGDESTGGKEAEEFFERLEDIMSLANNARGLSHKERLVALKSCLHGSRRTIYDNIIKQRRADGVAEEEPEACLLYTSPSPRDGLLSRMPSSA